MPLERFSGRQQTLPWCRRAGREHSGGPGAAAEHDSLLLQPILGLRVLEIALCPAAAGTLPQAPSTVLEHFPECAAAPAGSKLLFLQVSRLTPGHAQNCQVLCPGCRCAGSAVLLGCRSRQHVSGAGVQIWHLQDPQAASVLHDSKQTSPCCRGAGRVDPGGVGAAPALSGTLRVHRQQACCTT